MRKLAFIPFAILALIQFILGTLPSPPALSQEREPRVKPQGTLTIVDLSNPFQSVAWNYAESLLFPEKDNNYVPCLAENWRWIDDRTIEFKLREGATFHNGERFNAEAVRVNWEAYKSMEHPKDSRMEVIPDETVFKIIDDYKVRFTFPVPDGLALLKFWCFTQFAPPLVSERKFDEKTWGNLQEAGPWGAGLFKLVEGSLSFTEPGAQLVLEAYDGYWDPRYLKVKKVIFDNTIIGDRKEAMRLCMEEQGWGEQF